MKRLRSYRRTSVSFCLLTLLLVSCQNYEVRNPTLPAEFSETQATEEFKTLDELYLEVAKQIPSFAGVYEGNDGTLVAKVVPSTTLSAQQSSPDEVTVAEVRDALIEVMGTEVFTGVPNDLVTSTNPFQISTEEASSLALRLEDTKYTFEQLYTWLAQIAALNLEGVMIYDANEGNNNVYLGVETQAQAEVTKARIALLSIPSDAVDVEVVGPYEDLVLEGKELEDYLKQEKKEAAEAPLAAAATQYVDGYNTPLVGGVKILVERYNDQKSICTYGFSAKHNGVTGFVSNSHCTKSQNALDGAEVEQAGPMIGYETVDPRATDCGPIWNRCRYSDASFFKHTGPRDIAPRIAGTGPGPGDKSYTYTSRLIGIRWSTKQNEHYIAITARTGFTRLIVTNTCTYLRVSPTSTTVECGAVAKPEPGYPGVQPGDSGSPVITRDASGAVLVAQVFGRNTLAGTVWMNNSGGIWRDFGGERVLDYYW